MSLSQPYTWSGRALQTILIVSVAVLAASCKPQAAPLNTQAQTTTDALTKEMNTTNFNDEYYFLLQRSDSGDPLLGPDEDTKARVYEYEEIPMGSAPLVFINAYLEMDRAQGTKLHDTPAEVLFDGSDLIVQRDVRDALLKMDIPNIGLSQSVYIDHNEKRHEDLWYVLADRFDCWDRHKSEVLDGYDPEDEDIGGYEVTHFVLNKEVMAKTPLKDRLLFKMDQAAGGTITAHASVAKYFRGKSGVVVLPISEYGDRDKINTYVW